MPLLGYASLQHVGQQKEVHAAGAEITGSTLHRLALGMLFAGALAIRAVGITDPPLDFHPVKQYRSAMTARAYYYEHLPNVPDWKKEVSRAQMTELGTLVPPIIERMVAAAYRLAGGEYLWIGRSLGAISWVVGGVFLYLIARQIGSIDAAMLSVAFYLFLPFGIRASQSFQPDPAMVMMILIGLFTIVKFHQRYSTAGLLVAGMASGAAVLIKPVALFFILPGYVSLAIHKQRVCSAIFSRRFLAFLILSLVPGGLFYGYGLLFSEVLQNQAEVSFLPSLWLKARFWQFWLKHIYGVVGFASVLGGLLGLLLVPFDWRRTLIAGLWCGYLAYGMVFTYHIHTHDYYQLPLIPIVALSLGPLGAAVLGQVLQDEAGAARRLAVGTVTVLAVLLHLGLVIRARQELPDFAHQVGLAQEIGDAVGHSTRTIMLAAHSGRPLQYHGEFSGTYWPDQGEIRSSKLWGEREIAVRERLEAMIAKSGSEYFIVTDFQEFDAQADLKRLLTEAFASSVQKNRYWVFDIKTPAVR